MSAPRTPFYPVLHLDTGRTWGGGQQQVLYLHRGLVGRGVPSILVSPQRSPLARKAASESLPVFELKMKAGSWPLAAGRIARLARLHRVQTIHMHTSHAHSLGLIAARLLKSDVLKVVSRRVAFPRKPSMFTKRKYLGHGIRYIAISHAVEKTLLDLGVPGADISIVYSGIDVVRFSRVDAGKARQIADELGMPPQRQAFVVGSIGSLVRCKGHSVLIEALAEVVKTIPNVICVIIGEGPERVYLESLIERKGLQGTVILAGHRQEIPELLSLMDLFVMPSLQEGLGLALLEAMAAGKAVVASDVGGIPEVVVHGQTGFLVPAGKPEALAKAMVGLMRDPIRMSLLAPNAAKRVREHFSCESMVEGTLQVYRTLR